MAALDLVWHVSSSASFVAASQFPSIFIGLTSRPLVSNATNRTIPPSSLVSLLPFALPVPAFGSFCCCTGWFIMISPSSSSVQHLVHSAKAWTTNVDGGDDDNGARSSTRSRARDCLILLLSFRAGCDAMTSFGLALDDELMGAAVRVCVSALACRWVGGIDWQRRDGCNMAKQNATLRCPLAGTYPPLAPFRNSSSASASRHRPCTPGKPHRARTLFLLVGIQ